MAWDISKRLSGKLTWAFQDRAADQKAVELAVFEEIAAIFWSYRAAIDNSHLRDGLLRDVDRDPSADCRENFVYVFHCYSFLADGPKEWLVNWGIAGKQQGLVTILVRTRERPLTSLWHCQWVSPAGKLQLEVFDRIRVAFKTLASRLWPSIDLALYLWGLPKNINHVQTTVQSCLGISTYQLFLISRDSLLQQDEFIPLAFLQTFFAPCDR